MAGSLVLVLFIASLIGCVIAGWSTTAALIGGLVLFCGYALYRGNSPARVLLMCWEGVRPIVRILGMLLAVGALTGLWRASGVIPTIICYAVPLITPGFFIVMVFLLNCLVSVLTGTSFGTAATLGAISISLAQAAGVPVVVAGGAALSGAFFGDRWSPISTTALLVADITGTDFYENLSGMARTAAVPFFITCAIYLGLGLLTPAAGTATGTTDALAAAFQIAPQVLVPAVAVFACALVRVDILIAISAGIASSVPICMVVQHMTPAEVLHAAMFGYVPTAPGLAALAGGGITSMVSAIGIVCITSAYVGIFSHTDIVSGVEGVVRRAQRRHAPFAVMFGASIFTSMISCNQTLAIMLTHQLTKGDGPCDRQHAIDLEDSVVLMAGLVPWSIAGGVPLASMGAPSASMALAAFLYVVPLWRLACSRRRPTCRAAPRSRNATRTRRSCRSTMIRT